MNVRLYLIDRVVNLVEEGFDLAIRIGHLDDSALIARRIGEMRVIVTAAPDYIEAHGRPNTVNDLKDHNCIVDLTPWHGNRWPFFQNKVRRSVEVSGRHFANDGEMVRRMTLAGQGISMLPDFFLAEDLRTGRLVPLLDDVRCEEAGIFLIYVKERHRSAAIQTLIDWFINGVELENECGA